MSLHVFAALLFVTAVLIVFALLVAAALDARDGDRRSAAHTLVIASTISIMIILFGFAYLR